MKTFYILSLVLLTVLSVKAEEEFYDYDAALNQMEDKPRYGLFGNFNLNMHSTDFRSLPNVPSCCPKFTSGSGTGMNIGILYEHPIYKDIFAGSRTGFHTFSADLSELEPEFFIIDGKSYEGKIEHLVQSDFSRIFFEPYLAYRPIDFLFLRFGFDMGIMLGADYNQIEKIKDPPDRVTFSDGLRYRNKTEGEIEDVNKFNLGLKIGVGYELIISRNRSLRLTPEISYSYWMLPIVKDRTWNVHNLDFGIALKYIQPPPPPPPPLPPLSPPMPALDMPENPPALVASIRAVEVDANNRESQNFSLKLEDFTSLNLRPLLNFIFFDNNSSVLPERYIKIDKNEAEKFSMRTLVNADALETYYHVLNVIGLRLKENPEVTISLIGNNANKDAEKNNRDLSMARANTVKDYLTQVWNIDPKRISVSARNLPKEATDSDEPGADDENRRVEIVSNFKVISEPVITGDTLRVLSDSKIRFYPESNAEVGVKKWKLTVKHNNKTIKEFDGNEDLPKFVDWEITNEDQSFPKHSGTITYHLNVTDKLHQSIETKSQRIPIEQLTVDRKRLERKEDKEFEYYRLILFDYASSNLKDEHKQVVDYIKERIRPQSSVEIKGYTDRIGKEEVNLRISTQRANAVARRLAIPSAKVKGVGESELIYNNDLPEARFYCRTVTIYVETPVTE